MTSATPPFALGAYLNAPDNSNAASEAIFESNDASFTALMGTQPTFLDYFIDYSQPVSAWPSNAGWAAASAAASADAETATPVIALALNSTASGTATPDQQFQAFASGQYDANIKSVVQAWANNGFKNLIVRLGWEMNLTGPTYAGDTAQSQADWVAAYQHVYTVLHQAATSFGVSLQVMWNPGTTNYSNAEATTNLYPGNNYVDIIGADAYADMYPYSDTTSGAAQYHDWDTGGEDTTIAQFMADPVNRQHYWSYPAATKWQLDTSSGHSQSLASLIQFAEAQGKPFAIPETGAGNSNSATDVTDDAAFPQWLATQLGTAQAAGEKIDFVNLWDSNGGGNYEFSNASDGKPQEAAAWAQYFGVASSASAPSTPVSTVPAPVTFGSGPDTISLLISEDAWQGNAQYTVSVDGVGYGGTLTASASHAAGQDQTVNIQGNFASSAHQVTVTFLNDAYGGSASQDRNLYVDGVTFDGSAVPSGTVSLLGNGSQSVAIPASKAAPAFLTLDVAEDAWAGDAQFTVSVDGRTVGGALTASALHASGDSNVFVLSGAWAGGTAHQVQVAFTNDAYGGSAATDRNLYVTGLAFNGAAQANASATLLSNGVSTFTVGGTTAAGAAPADTLTLHLAEDAWQGDARFVLLLDGKAVSTAQAVTASHAAGAWQDVGFAGNFGAGTHTVGVQFTNDAYGGSASTDRNLYVNGIDLNGQHVGTGVTALLGNATASFAVSTAH